jgi:transglutaminase-like putative cysteine protease
MRYTIKHRTWYAYAEPAPVCHNLLHLAPRSAPRQSCLGHELEISPAPAVTDRRTDYFGNIVDYFSIEGSHHGLEVTSTSVVKLEPLGEIAAADSPPWEVVAKTAAATGDDLEVFQFSLPSSRVVLSADLRSYATASFTPQRPIVEALVDLTSRIYADFAFDAKATTVHTPLAEVLELRRGVCQDFAHLAAGCLRSLGLPARYVSGYLRTTPPPGEPRLAGADASHAWTSAWCGPLGWVDFDPTNNVLASDNHVTVAWGRDYGDVCPIQGVFVGGGGHSMGVSVDVIPEEDG